MYNESFSPSEDSFLNQLGIVKTLPSGIVLSLSVLFFKHTFRWFVLCVFKYQIKHIRKTQTAVFGHPRSAMPAAG